MGTETVTRYMWYLLLMAKLYAANKDYEQILTLRETDWIFFNYKQLVLLQHLQN